jgi:hypothetical protein
MAKMMSSYCKLIYKHAHLIVLIFNYVKTVVISLYHSKDSYTPKIVKLYIIPVFMLESHFSHQARSQDFAHRIEGVCMAKFVGNLVFDCKTYLSSYLFCSRSKFIFWKELNRKILYCSLYIIIAHADVLLVAFLEGLNAPTRLRFFQHPNIVKGLKSKNSQGKKKFFGWKKLQ